MTKKDYIIIATAIGQSVKETHAGDGVKTVVDRLIEHLSHALQVDNQGFKPAVFKAYIAKISRS